MNGTAISPEKYSNRILLAVTGLSPQIVTETLYALCVLQQPAFMPTEVHIITTAEGAERVRLNLLSEKGWFHRLRQDYDLPDIHFTADCVHVLEDVTGDRLSDIRTLDDNEQAANAITNKVREFTGKEDTALHVSIAGGRKTMGFYVGYALSLYGRDQDCLSHVLVNQPYESHPDFYYPTPYSRIIHTRFGNPKPMDTQEGKVTLAEIPFVRLRHGLSKDLLEKDTPFSIAVHAVQEELAPPKITLNLLDKTLYCGQEKIPMSTALFAFYVWFAVSKKEGQSLSWRDADTEQFLQLYKRIAGENDPHYIKVKRTLKNGFQENENSFQYRKANTNKALRKKLGAKTKNYAIQAVGKRPLTRFEIPLAADKIEIIYRNNNAEHNNPTSSYLFLLKPTNTLKGVPQG